VAVIRKQVVNPAAMTDLYVCAAANGAVISTVAFCNTTASAVLARLRLAPLGAADAQAQALWHDITVLANETFAQTLGICMLNTDVLRVQCTTAGVVFHCWGQEL
jgi:hypothetical protein